MREITPADDAKSGLQKIKDNPDTEIQLAKLAQYLEVGDRRLAEARQYRLDLLKDMRTGGATWGYLADMSGLSERYLRREIDGQ